MAEGKSGRGSTATTKKKSASKNETPNTPEVAESKIARMKVGELRKELERRGVGGTDKLRKDDLVQKLIKAERKDAKATRSSSSTKSAAAKGSSKSDKAATGAAKSSSGKKSASAATSGTKKSASAAVSGGKRSASAAASGGKKSASAATSGTKKSASAAVSGGKKSASGKTSRNDTPDTPEVAESKIARMKVGELRKELERRGVGGTDKLRKDDLVQKLIKAERKEAKASSTATTGRGKPTAGKSPSGKAAAGRSSSGKATAGIRTGKKTSKSLKYSQEITSPDQEPERPGRSLVTTDHDVIRQWAEARNGVPATIEGTEHGDHLGVLRFDFPGGDSGSPLRQVDWDQWFDTFDKRRLNFIYQEERSDGRQSNFFQLENPDREDA